jgi:hypothetical protein
VVVASVSSRPEVRELLDSIARRQAEIERLAAHLAELEEVGVSRYYRQSPRVFQLRHAVRACRSLLASLAPDGAQLNPWFVAICREACGRCFRARFVVEDWQSETRPVLEAFWHGAYFVRMLAGVERERGEPSTRLAGRAAVLELYGLR